MKREPGYYWVRFGNDDPEVAKWCSDPYLHDEWLRAGIDYGFLDEDITVMTSRLEPPT